MFWTPQHITHFFENNQVFSERYCRQQTRIALGNPAIDHVTMTRARHLAKRIAILMPYGIHNSPGWAIQPQPCFVVSCFSGAGGNMDGNWRVSAFFRNQQFYLGFHLHANAEPNLNGLRPPLEIRNDLVACDLNWIDFNPQNRNLSTRIDIPENGQFEGDHPLADDQPFSNVLKRINKEKFAITTQAWYESYLIARNEPTDGVIVPRVMEL